MRDRYPVTGLYAGQPGVLQPGGERSAILKTPLPRAAVTLAGLEGDAQADRRFHGGPDKALHQFAVPNYERLLARFPELAGRAHPGAIGENFSCPEMSEDAVCVGDRWRLGSAEVQITEPRNPCTKIDSRFELPGLASFIAGERLQGWYLRVTLPGVVELGEDFTLIARPNPTLSLARCLDLVAEHRPPLDDFAALAEASGLGVEWQRRLRGRLAFLRANAP